MLRQASFAPGGDSTEAFVGGALVPPDDAAADHAALFLMVGEVGTIEGEPCLMRHWSVQEAPEQITVTAAPNGEPPGT